VSFLLCDIVAGFIFGSVANLSEAGEVACKRPPWPCCDGGRQIAHECCERSMLSSVRR